MPIEQILKSWLRQKYIDNNTIKDTYKQEDPVYSGDTLVVPDTSNSLAEDTDINTLVTSLRKMQNNTYLRYSPLWSSVNINNVAEGNLIAVTKKNDVDNLITDLLGMCADYSKELACTSHQPNVATSYTRDCAHANNFSAFSNVHTVFSQSTSFSQRCNFYPFNRGANFGSNSRIFSFSTNFSQSCGQFSQSTSFSSNGGGTFSHTPGQVAVYGNHEVTFGHRFNASFIVKSDRSIVTHSNLVD